MITLFVGRHGETKLNSQNRLRGWLDEPLDANGIKEAHAMAEEMKEFQLHRVYSSSLDRADHTAQIVAEAQGLKNIPRTWFTPLNYGDLNGKKLSEIQPILDSLTERWKTDPTVKAPNGESFSEFQDRNLMGLHSVLRAAEDGEQLMIVAHLRNCLLFHAVALHGGPLAGDAIKAMRGDDWHQESGAVSRFEWDGNFRFVGLLGEASPAPRQAVS